MALGVALGVAACASAPPPATAEPSRPPDAGAIYDRAIADWERGLDQRALRGLQKLLGHYPGHFEGQRSLAEMLVGQHGAEAAVSFLRDRLEAGEGASGRAFALAWALVRTGDAGAMKEALARLRTLVEGDVPALVLETLGDVEAAMDGLEAAAARYEQAAPKRRSDGDLDGERQALLSAARYYHLGGDVASSVRVLEQAVLQASIVKSPWGEAEARQSLGAARQAQGDLAGALEQYEGAIRAGMAVGNVPIVVSGLVNKAEALALWWQDERARASFAEALGRAVDAGDAMLEGQVRIRRARFEATTGHALVGLSELQRAVDGLKETDHWSVLAEALLEAGRVHRVRGELKEAAGALAEAVQVHSVVAGEGNASVAGTRAKLELAETVLDMGAREDATSLFEEAYVAAAGLGHLPLQRRAARGAVLTELRGGEPTDLAAMFIRYSELGTVDPWLEAELYAVQGRVEEALRAVERAVGAEVDVAVDALPVRLGLMLALAGATGRRSLAFAAARAGGTAGFARTLQTHRVRIRRGIPREELAEADAQGARAAAVDALLAEPLPVSARVYWEQERKNIGRDRQTWRRRVAQAYPAWAGLLLPRVVLASVAPKPAPGELRVHVVAGESGAVAFLETAGALGMAPVAVAAGDGPVGPAFWKEVSLGGVSRASVSLPVGLVATPLAPPTGKTTLVRRRDPSPLAPPPAQPGQPLELAGAVDPATLDLSALADADLRGVTLTLTTTPATELDLVDASVGVALYAGADAVVVRGPHGDVTYRR